jgi:hypothetical protein
LTVKSSDGRLSRDALVGAYEGVRTDGPVRSRYRLVLERERFALAYGVPGGSEPFDVYRGSWSVEGSEIVLRTETHDRDHTVWRLVGTPIYLAEDVEEWVSGPCATVFHARTPEPGESRLAAALGEPPGDLVLGETWLRRAKGSQEW